MRLFLAARPHLYAALAMFLLIARMTVEKSAFVRGLLIAPVTILFFAVIVFYSLEYDAFAQSTRELRGEKKINDGGLQ